MSEKREMTDICGIGIGPSNLSAAALLQPMTRLKSIFFERKPEFAWHPGLLLEGACIQVSFLKDLVSLVDPTSRYSFVNFLVSQNRAYKFINCQYQKVLRREFNQYYKWVCAQLDNLRFGEEIERVSLVDGGFSIDRSNGRTYVRNVIMGVGHEKDIPDFAIPHLGNTILHSNDYLNYKVSSRGRRVVVVGGGQSGAEIVYDLLSSNEKLPDRLYWISSRANFSPLDESPFANELFSPSYSDAFYRWDEDVRKAALHEQVLSSDGIDISLLHDIYRRIYELEYIEGHHTPCVLHSKSEVLSIWREDDHSMVAVESQFFGRKTSLAADIIILATGLRYTIPAFLDPLMGRLEIVDGHLVVREDYSVSWNGPESNMIYAQNMAKMQRGVADPNLSLIARRSAIIINSILGEEVYAVGDSPSPFTEAQEVY